MVLISHSFPMSSCIQSENTNRSGDTMVDHYCNSLNILKEKVMTLIEHYHSVIVQKMECDLGNLLTYNADGFQSHLADVFSQLNDVEVQLNNLEAWAGLPPECFTSASMNCGVPDPDQASHEAQTLVEAIRHLQIELRGMVTKPTNHKFTVSGSASVSTNEKNDSYQAHTPYSAANTVTGQSPVVCSSMKSDTTPYFIQSSTNISPSTNDANQRYSDSLPQVPSCFSSNEESRIYPYPSNRTSYNSNTSSLTRSPSIERRQQPVASADTYRTLSGHHSSVSPSIPPQHYVPAQYSGHFPMSTSVETIPSNRINSEAYLQQASPATLPRTGELYPPRPSQ
ncbi:unnamed protein product [Heterobilharzia americana]|nr:unnamed protein product [Heterobilharzia americana]